MALEGAAALAGSPERRSRSPRRITRSPHRSDVTTDVLTEPERLPTSGHGDLLARAHPPPSSLLSPVARVVDVEHREREVSRAVVVVSQFIETEQYDVRQPANALPFYSCACSTPADGATLSLG